MSRNVLHDETKSGQITVISPAWRGNVRIQPVCRVLAGPAGRRPEDLMKRLGGPGVGGTRGLHRIEKAPSSRRSHEAQR